MEDTAFIAEKLDIDVELASLLRQPYGVEEAIRQKIMDVSSTYGPLYDRDIQWKSSSIVTPADKDREIIVKQFNLLAEGLSALPNAVPPFQAVEASDCGGFDGVERADTVFDFEG